ncbi:L-threonylcarbamoyladenylate synthase [Pseudoalteromonas sp. T1lg65]|uniref:L-threonylcarbamoyladenylate synthase n=1 Tax=Pseudoalteromonas sp. T1lg65 TaxID=2077101 RepID=UPI003F797345
MNKESNSQSLAYTAVEALAGGEVICYPTEAIFGLGCDPDNQKAVDTLLALKQRPVDKGLILIADNYAQCLRYIDDAKIPMDKRADIFSSWPGPVTWVLPAKASTPKWLTGQHSTLAIRITAHPIVKQLCREFGKPIVSTSANFAGQSPAMSIEEAKRLFADKVAFYVGGELGGNTQPSIIKDATTGKVIRG